MLLLLLVGCGGGETIAPAEAPSEAALRTRIKADSLDPWPHYELARFYEGRQLFERAIQEYGEAINLLPPRSATRAVLSLGILHHRMGNLEPASRCYAEVLSTIPSDTASYGDNDDYEVAALGTKALLEAAHKTQELAALHTRFLEEFGGSEEAWKQGATWLTPLESPPPRESLRETERPAERPGDAKTPRAQ